MKLHTFHKELSGILDHPDILPPPETLLSLAGREILGMARCYLDDGSSFLEKDDPVNALACFAYAAGWLDAGSFIGIVTPGPLCRNLLSDSNSVPGNHQHQLIEKACRYQRLLDRAVTSSVPGSEHGVHWYEGGERVITIATAYSIGGRTLLTMERYEDALGCFSYGHGWLDTALRVGLTRITGDRDLFAI